MQVERGGGERGKSVFRVQAINHLHKSRKQSSQRKERRGSGKKSREENRS